MISTGHRSSEEEDNEYDRMIRNVLLKGETGMWGGVSERSTRRVKERGGGREGGRDRGNKTDQRLGADQEGQS